MGASLKDFIARTGRGLAVTSHYIVMIRRPNIISRKQFTDKQFEDILLFCESASLPGMSYSTAAARTFGEVREMPYERTFDPAVLSFYVDKDMEVKLFFDEWMSGIQNPWTRTFSFYDDYKSDIEIEIHDKADNAKYLVTLHEAYPKTISSVDLSYSNKDVMKVSVTFTYRYWTAVQMMNVGGDDAGFGPRSLLDRVFEVPNKIWNSYVNFKDLF